MITLRNVTMQRGAKRLLEGANLTIFARQKVGLTGVNGSGKSSVLSMLRGELHSEAGDVDIQPGLVVAHVAQEMPATDRPALEFALDGDRELREIENAIAEAELADHQAPGHALGPLGELHERMAAIGGYSARARASQILSGLGFSQADLTRAVTEFSGGWRMRLNLAQALMTRSDLMMLDEPTNHLDLDAVIWLEEWLGRYEGTLVLISHDREFLDNTATHICHIENRTLKLYKGDYSDFERQRAAALEGQQAAYNKPQRQIDHLQQFVDRFRAKATKAKQAQSRLKALERLERIAAVQVDSGFTFKFREPVHAPQVLLTLEHVGAGYGERTVLDDLTLTLRAGERIGLLGVNGAGKSTLVKTLAGELTPLTGERREGKGLKIGYFAQHQLDLLRPDESPLKHLLRMERNTREQQLRDYLGGFNFRGDMVDAPVERFSGGEKSRLILALLIWQRPNLLLLDEPTNHLDLDTREALTIALQDFEGAVVVVSHDRHLLRATAETLLIVTGGKLNTFDGDLDDYRNWLATRNRDAASVPKAVAAAPQVDRKQQRRLEAEARNRVSSQRRPLEQRLRKLEDEIAKLTAQKKELESRLADPNLYSDSNGNKLQAGLEEQSRMQRRLQEAEEQWLQLQSQLEALAVS